MEMQYILNTCLCGGCFTLALCSFLFDRQVQLILMICSNGNGTEWRPIYSVIIQAIAKSDNRASRVPFVYHNYDCRPNWTTKSYYQLIIKITILRREEQLSYERKEKFALKHTALRCQKHNSKHVRNYNFECDWLIQTRTLNVIGLLNCSITNCRITTWQVNQQSTKLQFL